MELEKSYNIDAEQRHEYHYLVESRVRLTRNSAIRLSYRKRGVEEFSVAFDRYF